jgi:hypothetical protein
MRSTRIRIAAVLLVAASALSGCTAATPAPSIPTTRPVSSADADAAKLLEDPTIPPGARSVASLPGKEFASPSQMPGCQEIGLKTLYWVAPGSITSIADYLSSRPASGFERGNVGTAKLGGKLVSASVSESFMGKVGKQAKVVYTIAPTQNGRVGIRLDAEVVPVGAPCASAG